MAYGSKKLHFVLIPLMAQGHLIPMVDISKLLARQWQCSLVTIISTPQNTIRFEKSIDRARSESGLMIRIITFPFPYEQVGLPKGIESLDTLPCRDLLRRFYEAVDQLQEPLERFLEQQEIPPSCIISDKCLSWTSITAKKFNIPRIVFHGMSCFSLLISHNVHLHRSHLSASSHSQPFVIPSMPHKIQVTRAQLPGSFVKLKDLDDIRDKMREAEAEAFGVIVNSFQDLEHGCAEAYAEAIKKKVWCVGPVSLCNERASDVFDRGNNENMGISRSECLEFLNSMTPKSVIYACLGSLCRLIPKQLVELGLGLEESGKPFIWVVKTGDQKHVDELNEWLEREKFEARVRGRGLVIKGWAPQTMILSHGSVGGFLTHCGWNSTIEAISSGVPMMTWPLFAEQFLNEKMIVEILKVGVKTGIEIPVRWGDEEKLGVMVKKEKILEAIELLMNDADEEIVSRRRNAQELAVRARKAMDEGGSSHTNLLIMIQDVFKQFTLR